MTTTKDNAERLKLYEAIGATALLAFVAASLVISFAVLAMRCVIIDAVDQFKRKGD